MQAVLFLIVMLFLHVFADYNMQGIMASMKQKSWWVRQCRDGNVKWADLAGKYKNDYKVAIAVHAFEWSFVVFLPLMILCFINLSYWPRFVIYLCLLVANTWFHAIVDDSKANKGQLNLIEDQILHLIQIVVSWGLATIFYLW